MSEIHKSKAEHDDPVQAGYPVTIIGGGEAQYICRKNETLLQGMLRLGCKGIPVGCLGGGCGVCKIRIRQGAIHELGPMSRAHISVEEEEQKVYLACRIAPVEALEIEVLSRAINKSLAFLWQASEEDEGRSRLKHITKEEA